MQAVRRINQRWIVHGGLRNSTAEFLKELAKTDPARLNKCCQLAMDLVHSRSGHADPKPWFYAGLFAYARHDEANRFLAEHPLTHTVWCILHGDTLPTKSTDSLHDIARKIADTIRTKQSIISP